MVGGWKMVFGWDIVCYSVEIEERGGGMGDMSGWL